MLKPYEHKDKTFIYIDEKFYSFGTCYGFSEKMFTKPQRCWMAFPEDRILCGDEAYKSIERIKFPVFEDPVRIQQILNSINEHYIQKLEFSFDGISMEKPLPTIHVNICYYIMVCHIIMSFYQNTKIYGYKLEEVTVFISDLINTHIVDEIKQIIIELANTFNFKVQFVNLTEAILDRLSIKDCSSTLYAPRNPCQLLTIDIGSEKTKLELFKGKQYKNKNYIRFIIDPLGGEYIIIDYNGFNKILGLFNNFKDFKEKTLDEQLEIDNAFRKALNLPYYKMNEIIYCTFNFEYHISNPVVEWKELNKFTNLNKEDFEKIKQLFGSQLQVFNNLNIDQQLEILKNIGKEINKEIFPESDRLIKQVTYRHDYFLCHPLPTLFGNINIINFYSIDLYKSSIINCGNNNIEVLFEEIKQFIDENFDKTYENNKELKYIINDVYFKYNSKFEIGFKENVINKVERYIEMSELPITENSEFNYTAGAYYLYNHQYIFNKNSPHKINKPCYHDYAIYYTNLKQWLDNNHYRRIDVETKINMEKEALKKIIQSSGNIFDVVKFDDAIKYFKYDYRIAEEFKEAYLQWRQQFCSDKQIAGLITDPNLRLF